MRPTVFSAVAAAVLIFVSSAGAAPLMLQPVSAYSPTENNDGSLYGPVSLTVDQSGLEFNPYVSGVTDYATYIASDPYHSGYTNSGGVATALPTILDFDLGATYLVDRLAFWNYHLAGQGSVTGMEVFTADNAGFVNATQVATLSPVANGVTTFFPYGSSLVQDFDLTDSTARYVRFSITSIRIDCPICLLGPQTAGIGEVAFGVEAAVVPLPAAAWLLLSGIGGLGFVRRWQAS